MDFEQAKLLLDVAHLCRDIPAVKHIAAEAMFQLQDINKACAEEQAKRAEAEAKAKVEAEAKAKASADKAAADGAKADTDSPATYASAAKANPMGLGGKIG